MFKSLIIFGKSTFLSHLDVMRIGTASLLLQRYFCAAIQVGLDECHADAVLFSPSNPKKERVCVVNCI